MLKTFKKGGIHPPENKFSAHNGIRKLPLPGSVAILLSQHLGAPAKVIVNKGDEVKTGQLIATGEGFVSSNVHASVSGKIAKIDDVTDISGYRKQAVFIDVAGDEWIETIKRDNTLEKDIQLTGEEIIKKLNDAVFEGPGGVTFPRTLYVSAPRG